MSTNWQLIFSIIAIFSFFLVHWLYDLRKQRRPRPDQNLETDDNSIYRMSNEVDRIVQQITKIAKERVRELGDIQKKLNEMKDEEKTLRTNLESLKSSPPYEYFENYLNKREKINQWRANLFFTLGVTVPFVINFLISLK